MAKRYAAPNSSMGRQAGSPVPRLLIVCLALSAVLLGVGLREGTGGPLHAVRGAFQLVTSPVRYVGAAATVPFQGLGNVVGNLTASGDTLSDLKSENERLTAEVARLSEYEQQANTLSGLLQLRSAYSLTSTAARVIAGSTDSWSTSVTIDKGSSSGLAVGMPVTSDTGVIGQISECGANTATVRLVTDESSGVSAMVQSSRAQGQLAGSPDGSLRLKLIRTDQTVNVGDIVVTSGLGGVYPKGLPIGTVSNVTKTAGAMYYDISVDMLSSVQGLEEVLVITSVSEEQQATDDDAQAAGTQDATATTQDAAAQTDQAQTDDAAGMGDAAGSEGE